MIRITIELSNIEAKALGIMCQRFKFDNAQEFVRDTNVRPDALCEAVTKLREAIKAIQGLSGSR